MGFERLQDKVILLDVLLNSKIMKFSCQNEIMWLMKAQNGENKWLSAKTFI